jgi:cytidylate kinase
MAIITISREMGSGGIPIAHQVAESLGYSLIDGEMLKEVAGEYGLSPEALEQADEKPPAFVAERDDQIAVDLHQIELIILERALKGDVIIYGRGGQDLLKQASNLFRVRIVAPFEERVERWAEREWLDPDYARILVRKSDQQRAGFIKYYFDRDWDDPLGYDLIINTSRLSEEMAVELICQGVKDKNLVERKNQSKKILTDLILRKKVEIAILSEESIEGYHVEIDVADGVVTLAGHVHDDKELKTVLAITDRIEGVTKVNNKIKVVNYRTYPIDH